MDVNEQRWQILRAVAEEEARSLQAEIERGDASSPGWERDADRWAANVLARDVHVCDQSTVPDCGHPDPEHDGSRCSTAYWRKHSVHVADSLQRLARELGEDPVLWALVGRLHDADYPAHPHHAPEVSPTDGHPMTLLRELERVGAPASVRLAVLEHAAHTDLEPSSQLSAALILADEHSTTTAYGGSLDLDEAGARRLVALLAPAPHRLTDGYFRGDMSVRAAMAARVLVEP